MKTTRIIAIIFVLAFSVCSYVLIAGTTGGFESGSGYADADMESVYYGRTASSFGITLKVLCNKCHAKD